MVGHQSAGGRWCVIGVISLHHLVAFFFFLSLIFFLDLWLFLVSGLLILPSCWQRQQQASSWWVLSYWLSSTYHNSLNLCCFSLDPCCSPFCHAPLQTAWLCLLEHVLESPDLLRGHAPNLFQFINVFHVLMIQNMGHTFLDMS